MKNIFKKSYYIISILILCFPILFLRIYGWKHSPDGPQSIPALRKSFGNEEKVVPIVVIGGGSAGLSAGIYAARTNRYTLVITGKQPGGQLGNTSYVDNMPGSFHQLGADIMTNMRNQAVECGAQFLDETVQSVEFNKKYSATTGEFENDIVIKTEEGSEFHALTLIITTGASPRLLNIPGEKKYWGHGVTTCALCDGAFHKDQDVVVIGGGDSAAEHASYLSGIAKTVTICVRKDEMRASGAMKKKINLPNVSIMFNTELKEIGGDDEKVTEVTLFNNKTNTSSSKKVTGVFLAIGHEPNTGFFKDALETDQSGYLLLKGRTQETSWPGVFAAGDVADPTYKQAVIAAGDGAKAAIEAHKYLENLGFNNEKATQLASNYFIVPTQSKTITSELHKIASNEEFDQLVHADNPLIVDFYTDTCPSCLQMLPIVKEVASDYTNKLTVVKCDAGVQKEIAKKYKIASVPALVAFKNGKETNRSMESLNKKQINEFFAAAV